MYSIEFIINWIKSMSKFRVFLLVLNFAVIFFSAAIMFKSGFFTSKYYNDEKFVTGIFLFIVSFLNAFFIIKTHDKPKTKDNKSLIGLWLKRKRLENEAKIKELEK
ncbi:MAG: hypothetical protein RAM38_08865 [Arsenophonus sp.]|nr:hypothetical protein [Arsenophonus sp.]MDR5610601.1 hypothetical protein [Arsenophonus sp.]MDR5614391.1 hypothetical protein [Arsenophonus sp.]